MVRTNPTFMDDPSKPSKPFRDVLARRRKKQEDAITKALTPVLSRTFADYCQSGQEMPSATVVLRRAELGRTLESALDGEYDGNISCAYCTAEKKTAERLHAAGPGAEQVGCNRRTPEPPRFA